MGAGGTQMLELAPRRALQKFMNREHCRLLMRNSRATPVPMYADMRCLRVDMHAVSICTWPGTGGQARGKK